MNKRTFHLLDMHVKARVSHEVLNAPIGYVVVIQEENRNLLQNAAQWPILQAFSKQLKWPVNGEMVYLTDEEWKDLLSAAYKKETIRMAMGLDGGVVMLGQRTSKFSKKEFSDWLEYLHAVAAMRGVVFSQ